MDSAEAVEEDSVDSAEAVEEDSVDSVEEEAVEEAEKVKASYIDMRKMILILTKKSYQRTKLDSQHFQE